MRIQLAFLITIGAGIMLASCASNTARTQWDLRVDRGTVGMVLDGWHADASAGNFDAYFGAMTEDSVFLGTDASERWTKHEFMGYAREPFSDGSGWIYMPSERFIAFDDDRETAWVDEVLTNAKYGTLRGTAVLRLVGGAWKIAHYSLTFLVPNEKAARVVEIIGEQ